MPIDLLLIIFFMSLFFGSFYNVVGIRVLKKESIVFPNSHCTVCNHRLGILDLFPVFSYVFLGGKCRYCKTKISPIYPFGEILTAVAYTLVFNKYGLTLNTVIHLVFVTIMVFCTITDIKETIVPDRFIVIGLVPVLILRIISGESLPFYILSGLGAFGIMLIIFLLSNQGLGGADVKLYALIGLTIGGSAAFSSLFYACIIGVIFNLKAFKKENKGKEIPFVPYIFLGVLITYIFNIYNFVTLI